MTTIVRVSDPAHLLSLVPSLAGCTPAQSVVLLPFVNGRTQGALRLDLPRDDISAFAATAMGLACRVSGIDAVAIVVYSDEPLDRFSVGDPLRDALSHCADTCGLRVVESLRLGPGGWLTTGSTHVRALDELPEVPSVPGIGDVRGDQRTGAALPRADFAAKERVGRALDELEKVFDIMRVHAPETDEDSSAEDNSNEERIDPRALETFLRLDDIPQFYEEVLDDASQLDPYTTAALAWCFTTPMLRDVALVQWASDILVGDEAFDAQLRYAHSHEQIPPHIGDVLIGRGERPDRDRMLLALTVVRTAAAHAPRPARVGLLAGAAWISWALGRSTHAEQYLSLVHDIDPEHTFAGLLRSLVASALLPDWVFDVPEITET